MAGPPPEKKPRAQSTADDLSDVEDSSDEVLEHGNEVAVYIEFKTPKEDPFEVLFWWKEQAKMFPNLALIAHSVLAIPASSAASERDFS